MIIKQKKFMPLVTETHHGLAYDRDLKSAYNPKNFFGPELIFILH